MSDLTTDSEPTYELVATSTYDVDTGEVADVEVTFAPEEIHVSHELLSQRDDRFIQFDDETGFWTFGSINPATYEEAGMTPTFRMMRLVVWEGEGEQPIKPS